MTVTDRPSENDMTPLFRTQIKANGITIWEIASASGLTYHTTIWDGRVTSCETTTGEPCKGFRYHQGKCHHATLALAREATRDTESKTQEEISREALPLNGNRAFSLLE